jgi:hypothetical protein
MQNYFKKYLLGCLLLFLVVMIAGPINNYISKNPVGKMTASIFDPNTLPADAMPASGFAWNDNTGWINFGDENSSSTGRVYVSNNKLYGFAWGENVGWISMTCENDTACTEEYGVTQNDSDGTLTGYAWGENVGWIDFAPDGGGVFVSTSTSGTNTLSGYAWGENIGWISFSCENDDSCGTADYGVTTTWTAPEILISAISSDNLTSPFRISKNTTTTFSATVTGRNNTDVTWSLSSVNAGTIDANGLYTASNTSGDYTLTATADVDPSVSTTTTITIKSSGSNCNACIYSEWGSCINNQRTRTVDQSNCCTTESLTESCTSEVATSTATTTATTTPVATTTATSSEQIATSTATTTITKENTSTSTIIVTEENKESIINTITNLFTPEDKSDNNSPAVSNSNTTNTDSRKSGNRSSGGSKVVDNIVSALDVSSFVKDNVAVLGTTTERIILGAQKVLESRTGDIVAKTVTTAGVVVGGGAIASGAMAMSGTAAADLLFLPFKLWGLLLSVLGLKKRNRPWGTVYDSVTKQPLDPAYVTIKNVKTGKEETSITDLDGRYGFLVQPGEYIITANKTNYTFPSKKLAGKTEDALYNSLYFGETLNITVAGAVISKNIPLDPVKFDWNEFTKGKKGLMKFYSRREKIMKIVTDWVFRIGLIISLVSLFLVSAPYNYIIFALYIVLVLVRKFGLRQKAAGILTDKGNNPLSFAIVRVFDADLKVLISTKVADRIGRYYCLVNKGKYYVTIEKKNDDESYTEIFTSPTINAGNGIINNSFII